MSIILTTDGESRDYDWLKTQVARWLHRSDLTDDIPTFIDIAQAEINRELNVVAMEVEAELTTQVGYRYVDRPTDFGSPIGLWLTTIQPRDQLTARLPETLPVDEDTPGRPYYYAIEQEYITFERPADQEYTLTLRYVQDIALSEESPTNDILSRNPDLYIFGALAQAAPFLKQDSRVALWEAKFQKVLAQVKRQANRNKAVANLMTDVPLRRTTFNINEGA